MSCPGCNNGSCVPCTMRQIEQESAWDRIPCPRCEHPSLAHWLDYNGTRFPKWRVFECYKCHYKRKTEL